jgi:non-ribosomal peptide synthetase component F
LTYQQLSEASSALAGNLKGLGVTNGTPVLLLTAHGTFNIIAILAILKAGGFFVPIDRSTWSPDAIQYVFDTVDSQVAINTTPEPFASPGGRFCHVLHLTQLPQAQALARPDELLQQTSPLTQAERTACTIFTSGSTGRAKGVMISHRSIARYAKMSPANLDIRPGDRLLHLLSVAFDGTWLEYHVHTRAYINIMRVRSLRLCALLGITQRWHGCTRTGGGSSQP